LQNSEKSSVPNKQSRLVRGGSNKVRVTLTFVKGVYALGYILRVATGERHLSFGFRKRVVYR